MAGSGTVVSTSGSRLDVIQTSARLGIEWQDFSIGRGEQVNFSQPSRSAVALNRVTGTGISNIEGLLTANGNVFLVNRNGVIFHGSAVVDVGGLLATTSDISNQDFLSGRYAFKRPGNPNGRVVNEGAISVAEGGLVALVAPSVRNAGVIEARLGRVALGSGTGFTLDLYGDELVSFAVDREVVAGLTGPDGETIEARVDHSGTIEAAGGRVWLSAQGAREVVDQAINLSGVVRAQTVSQREGRIVLAGGGGRVEVTGSLTADGGPDQAGGEIQVLGSSVHLRTGASLDASGGTGGGSVRVGGGLRGRGSLPRSSRTTVDAGAAVRADALLNGDGGTIVVWSDERTAVDGVLSARGGPAAGDGGLVETSSAGELVFSMPAQVGAPAGRAGTWLLDPEDIDIGRGEADAIEATLNEGGNVSIETADAGDGEGNIAVNASITKSEGDDARLSMTAHGSIDVNQPIRSEAGRLDVSLKAGRDVNVNAGVETNGGKFSSGITGVKEPEPEPADATGVQEPEPEPADTADVQDPEPGPVDTTDVQDPEPGPADTMGVQDPEPGLTDTGDEGTGTATVDAPAETDPGTTAGDDPDLEAIESAEHAAATAAPVDDSPAPRPPVVRVVDSVTTKGGDISVDAGGTGAAFVTGTLDSSNLEAGETGGDIEVLGEHVVVAGDAVVDASGDTGGGDIHVGGDYRGEGERHNAETTTIGDRVVIRSDATGDGDAGTVVVWADGTTRFGGHIRARGGPAGGDGGTVEVSGKQNLGFRGTVDVSAPAGETGSLLLDPETLTIIDALPGAGDHDANVLCAVDSSGCWFPPGIIVSDLWTPEVFESFGIDPFPETALNTLSWGRIMQLAETTLGPTPFNLRLEAEQDVTFAALNGTVSTPGSPAGGTGGWTVTVNMQPAYVFTVASKHGDILFEDLTDNFAIRGGRVRFDAPEGKLTLGNLYSYSLNPAQGTDPFAALKTPPGFVHLVAGEDISVGTINTRYEPYRYADPATGAPQPQPLLITDTSTFDPDAIPLAALTDLGPGGDIFISSTGGSIDIRGPVFNGAAQFTAVSAGDFSADVIDTGANRVIVKHSVDDPGSLNTLSTGGALTGGVSISAEEIEFEQINAGEVSLTASRGSETISGKVVFDNFNQSDFIGGRPDGDIWQFASPSRTGLSLTVGDTDGGDCAGNCIDNLRFTLNNLGSLDNLGLDTGDVLDQVDSTLGLDGTVQRNLGPEFSFSGGAVPQCVVDGNVITCMAPLRVPMALDRAGPAQSAVPIAVPLPLVVPLGVTPPDVAPAGDPPPGPGAGPTVAFVPSPVQPPAAGGNEAPQDAGGPAVTPSSSADVARIRTEGEETQDADAAAGCQGEDNFEWLGEGAPNVARVLDWGRRSGIGADPKGIEDVFKPGNCYL